MPGREGGLTHEDSPQAPAVPASRPSPPTRQWHMTPQEQDMMACFRQDYLDLLDGRVESISRLVASHELEPAQVALLSLESSSAMVGAGELAAAVRRLRTSLDGSSAEELDVLTASVVAEAAQVAGRLADRNDQAS